jgi:hypothetical protein
LPSNSQSFELFPSFSWFFSPAQTCRATSDIVTRALPVAENVWVFRLPGEDSSDNIEDPEQKPAYDAELQGSTSTSPVVEGIPSVLLLTTADGGPQLSRRIGDEDGAKDETTSVGEPDCVRSACSDVSPWFSCRTPTPEAFDTEHAESLCIALLYVEAFHWPWEDVIVFLDTLDISVFELCFEDMVSSPSSCTGLLLPEDYPLQGSILTQNISPSGFFHDYGVDQDQGNLASTSRDTSLGLPDPSNEASIFPQFASSTPASIESNNIYPPRPSSATKNPLSCVVCQKTLAGHTG